MKIRYIALFAFAALSAMALPNTVQARGFGGGGGFHGGGGFGGGGFGGGAHFGGGDFGGGGFGGGDRGFGGAGGFDGGDRGFGGAGGFGGADRGFGGAGAYGDRGYGGAGGLPRGNFPAGDLGGLSRGDLGGFPGGAGSFAGARGDYAQSLSRGQLNGFLGLPSDEGAHALGSNFNVNAGAVEGPRGGVAAGASVEGPRGNEVARGAAVGPDGRAVAGEGVRTAGGYGAGRGVAVGPNGMAAGFGRVTPTDRYFTGRMVQGNYHNWGIYGHDWYAAHPGAWYAAGWATGAAWTAATWPVIGTWFDYPATIQPVDYDYGNNITYNDNSVYVNGQSAGTDQQYYQQSAALADSGSQATSTPDEQWLPLGVFALVAKDHDKSTLTIQLAVNKQGVLRGNYDDSKTNQVMPIQGSVDKSTQRVAFTVGDKKDVIFETGLYNLTKDESPILVEHTDRTEQWVLVRLKPPADGGNAEALPDAPANENPGPPSQ